MKATHQHNQEQIGTKYSARDLHHSMSTSYRHHTFATPPQTETKEHSDSFSYSESDKERNIMWALINNIPKRRSLQILRYFTIMSANSDYPSTLTTEPVSALVPPGKCQFGEDFASVSLLKKWKVSGTSSVLRFGLPNEAEPLNLSTCACILAKADLPDRDGKIEGVVRPYTPISTNAQVGSFDLLIKDYGEDGRMSTHLCSLEEGADVAFKHIEPNVKIQAPFPYKKVCMLVGGTGITPMVQAIHAVLGDSSSTTDVVMLYGSRASDDILGQDLLDSWSSSSDRLSVTHVLSHEPEKSDWDGARGHIDKELVEKNFPAPADKDFVIFVCGPPPMYKALCGPRDEKDISGLLKEMGYSADQVFKF